MVVDCYTKGLLSNFGLQIVYKSSICGIFMLSSIMNFFSKIFGVSITDADKDKDENFLTPKYNSEDTDLSNLKFTVPNPATISLDGGEGGSFDFQGDYDKLRELVNQANEFWMIELSASSNSFFQCHIGHNIYEYWKDGEMIFSSKGGTDEALTFFWELTN